MESATRGNEDWQVLEFLATLAADLESGVRRPLAEYLPRYPGREEVVAREYLSLAGAAAHDDREPFGALDTVGPYRIARELGRGGQGTVYEARHADTGHRVALKVLRNPLRSGTSPQRFLREAALASRLDHPGICPIRDSGAAGDALYIAMDFVSGTSLDRRLEDPAARPDWRTAVGWIEQAARALDVAHRAGIVHRDIKPGNIMIDADGRPVLLDFGLARDVESESSLTHTGDLFGTPAYMSPEQLAPGAGSIDHTSDLWSLAVVLYESLTGRRPFDSATREGLFEAIRKRDPDSVRRHVPDLPRALDVVIAVALDKSPARRFHSAGQLADELRRILVGEPIHSRPPGFAVRAARWCARYPATAGVAAAVFVLLGVALYYTDSQRQVQAGLRQTADAYAGDLRRLARHILVDLHDAVQDMPGATIANKQIVERALQFLQLLQREGRPLDPESRRDLALAHLKIGDVLGNSAYANLGQPAQALEHYREALRHAEAIAPGADPDLRSRIQLRLGDAFERGGDLEKAIAAYRRGLELVTPAGASTVRGALHRRHAACIAHSARDTARTRNALAELDRALEALPADGGPGFAVERAETLLHAAQFLLRLGEGDAAGQRGATARDLLAGLDTTDRARLPVRLLEARCAAILAEVAEREGRAVEATALRRFATDGLTILVELDPANELARRRLIEARIELGLDRKDAEAFAEAQRSYETALELTEDSEPRFGSSWAEYYRGKCYLHLADLHRARFEHDDALELFEKARVVWAGRHAADPANTELRELLARCEQGIGGTLYRRREVEASRAALHRARAHFEALERADPENVKHTRAQQHIAQILAELWFQGGDFGKAAAQFQVAVDIRLRSEGDAGDVGATRSLAILYQGLANATYQARKFEDGHASMLKSLALFRRNAERQPDDALCGRQLAYALLDTARMTRRAGGNAAATKVIEEAATLATRYGAAPDASTKAIQTLVYVKVFEGYLRLEAGDRSAARDCLKAADAAQKRIGQPMMPMYASLRQRVAAKLR